MLKDRVIVVTGSSSGIGRSCVEMILAKDISKSKDQQRLG